MPVPPNWPDDGPDVDREIRIERMKRELNELAGGKMLSGGFGSLPSELEEIFLEQVLAFERAEVDTNFNRLVRGGVVLPPAAELDEHSLREKLAEIIVELAKLRTFLEDTNHLSDHELYDWLWRDGLRSPTEDMSAIPEGAWHTSPIGSGSEEDIKVWLKYYANEEDRVRWQQEFPNDQIPVRENLPYDRDRYLPKATDF